jgi:hypothetical protein
MLNNPDNIYINDSDISSFKNNVLRSYSEPSQDDIIKHLITDVIKIKRVLQTPDSDLVYLRSRVDVLEMELNRLREPAKMMMSLLKVINETPALQSEWDKFATLLKLASSPEDFKNG